MGGNLAKELEKAKIKEINELDLRNRGITEIPPNIGTLESLIRLNLSNNKISILPSQIGKLYKYL